MHDADASFGNVQANYPAWRHEERPREAFIADAEEQKSLGASISTISIQGPEAGDPEPLEDEETVRIWRDGERFAKNIMAARGTATTRLLTDRCGGWDVQESGDVTCLSRPRPQRSWRNRSLPKPCPAEIGGRAAGF